MQNSKLIELAKQAMQNSYSPYSNFKVGAALLCKNGKVFLGTNVENGAYGPSNCAERSAFFSAISNGEREFEKIAIVSSGNAITYPCGICRQVMLELAPDLDVICAKDEKTFFVHKIADLLPFAFKL